jgi:hypothetical protein
LWDRDDPPFKGDKGDRWVVLATTIYIIGAT